MSTTHRLKISKTQAIALKLLNDPEVTTLLFGGGAGGAKSVIVCLWMAMQCRDYPGIKIGLGRKELKRLKETTLQTLLQKAHKYLGVEDHEFVYNDQKGTVTYVNGSQIQLIDMAWQPSDPDFDTFGSLEFTHVVIEEVGEIVQQAVDVLTSRKNRWLNAEYGITGKSVMSCNPTQNFIRDRYYEPYLKLGGGKCQIWEDGRVELPNGQMVPAKTAFVRSLAADNPFLSRNYIEDLKGKPGPIKKRLLYGDWDYGDDDHLAFPSSFIDRSMVSEVEAAETVVKGVGLDVADKGIDKPVLSYQENDVLLEQEEVQLNKEPGAKSIGLQLALATIRFAQQRGVTARNVGFDCVGVGSSVRDNLKNRGWACLEFSAGAPATQPGYYNIASEVAWQMREDMDSGKYRIHQDLKSKTQLRKEMLAHPYDDDPVIRVRKDKAKEELGHSPDYFDSALISRWAAHGGKSNKKKGGRILNL